MCTSQYTSQYLCPGSGLNFGTDYEVLTVDAICWLQSSDHLMSLGKLNQAGYLRHNPVGKIFKSLKSRVNNGREINL